MRKSPRSDANKASKMVSSIYRKLNYLLANTHELPEEARGNERVNSVAHNALDEKRFYCIKI